MSRYSQLVYSTNRLHLYNLSNEVFSISPDLFITISIGKTKLGGRQVYRTVSGNSAVEYRH